MNSSDLNTLCVCAFRYALGRNTYMPSLIVDILTKELPELESATKEIMAREIRWAIERNEAGWSCDVETWCGFLETLIRGYKDDEK